MTAPAGPGPLAVPRPGAGADRVGGWVHTGHDEVARVFLPVTGTWDREHPWPGLAVRAGVPWSGRVRWSALEAGLGSAVREDQLSPAHGVLAPVVASAVADVLRSLTSTPERCWLGLWRVYAEEPADAVPAPPGLAPLDERGEHLDWLRGGVGLLVERSRGVDHPPTGLLLDGVRAPMFVWPDDGAFLLCCPPYGDSLLLSGPAGLLGALRAAGLTAEPVAVDDELPVEGD